MPQASYHKSKASQLFEKIIHHKIFQKSEGLQDEESTNSSEV